jgi:hypothetical protein
VILDWLKTREELDLLFCILEHIKWSLREEKLKTGVCIICETMIDFEGVSMRSSLSRSFPSRPGVEFFFK